MTTSKDSGMHLEIRAMCQTMRLCPLCNAELWRSGRREERLAEGWQGKTGTSIESVYSSKHSSLVSGQGSQTGKA